MFYKRELIKQEIIIIYRKNDLKCVFNLFTKLNLNNKENCLN